MAKVKMRHEKSQVVQDTSRDAFDRVWSQEGWRLIEESAASATANEVEELDRDVLLARAEELGIRVRGNAKAETIAARIEEHLARHGDDPDEDTDRDIDLDDEVD